jgi:hypothetical protein
MFHFALNIGGISAQSHMSFVFPATLIWLLHCNAIVINVISPGTHSLQYE